MCRVLVREQGIDRGRTTSLGYGADRPVADESTAEGLQAANWEGQDVTRP